MYMVEDDCEDPGAGQFGTGIDGMATAEMET